MKRFGLCIAVALTLLAAACSSGSGGTGSTGANGQVNLVLWMGYTPPPPVSQSAEYISLKALVAKFTQEHPKIHIRMEYVNNDYALQKVTVALQGGEQPDISYQYGTNMPQVSQAPVNYFEATLAFGDLTLAEATANLTAFAEVVMPAVRAAFTARGR